VNKVNHFKFFNIPDLSSHDSVLDFEIESESGGKRHEEKF